MIKNMFFRNRLKNNRKGIIMFVVIGAIVVLTLLVTSYNYLVRGKFNESREILKHLRATKCSQAVCKYIFTFLLSDLHGSSGTKSADILHDIFLNCNDQYKLKERFEKEWLIGTQYEDFCKSILKDTTGNEKIDCEVDVGFSNVTSLDSIRNSKGISSNVFFFDGEKVGRLTIRVSVKIGKSCGIWQETRPFKVIFPFPVPITKFNFYWKDGPDNPLIFNTVSLKSDDCVPANGKFPLLFDNGSSDNSKEDVWQNRGWIYVGGEGLVLNRARGDKKYGQRFFSYPRTGEPISLMLNFPSGDGWKHDDYKYKGEFLGFRRAYWGFSDSLTKNTSQNSWKTILKSDYEDHNPNEEANKVYWYSSSLHLFSDDNVLTSNSPKDIEPTITRVVGKVIDRYLEIGYLLPENSDSDTVDSIFAAVVGLNKKEYEDLQSKGLSDISEDKFTFENNLFFSEGYDFESDSDKSGAKVIQSYFNKLPYKVEGDSVADYYTVMSKSAFRDMDETYDIIAQYSNDDENVNIPPKSSVPKITDLRFLPQNNFSSNFPSGILPSKVMNLDIPKIADIDDSSFGLSLRTCYEITGDSESIVQNLKRCFGSNSSPSDLDLNNCVYKLSPDSGSLSINNISVNTPGTIFSKGPITIGNFLYSNKDAEKVPLLLLAENGAISIDNSGKSEVRAYLIALGEGGTVKAIRKDSPLKILGGMALKEFSPDNIPDKGGCLVYNEGLNPIGDEFKDYWGIVFGPRGGGL